MPSPHDRTIADLMSHSEGARRLALSLLRDPHQAEDVAQDALLAAVQEIGRLVEVATPTVDVVLALVQQRARGAGSYLKTLG